MFTKRHNLARNGLLSAFNRYLAGESDNTLLRQAVETVAKNIQAEEEQLKTVQK